MTFPVARETCTTGRGTAVTFGIGQATLNQTATYPRHSPNQYNAVANGV